MSCYVGALAVARFPGRSDKDAYKKIVNKYSGMKSLYNKVDLLFFYQWSRSSYRRSKDKRSAPYRKISGYSQIKRKIIGRFGNEQSIRDNPKRRYITIPTLLKLFDPIPRGLNRRKIYEDIKLFTISEILYRYVRCHAVHENSFPLIRTVSCVNGTTRYEDGHLITGLRLLETVENIVNNLKKECLSKSKFPWELFNR